VVGGFWRSEATTSKIRRPNLGSSNICIENALAKRMCFGSKPFQCFGLTLLLDEYVVLDFIYNFFYFLKWTFKNSKENAFLFFLKIKNKK